MYPKRTENRVHFQQWHQVPFCFLYKWLAQCRPPHLLNKLTKNVYMCISIKYRGTYSLTFHWKEAHGDLSTSSELTRVSLASRCTGAFSGHHSGSPQRSLRSLCDNRKHFSHKSGPSFLFHSCCLFQWHHSILFWVWDNQKIFYEVLAGLRKWKPCWLGHR